MRTLVSLVTYFVRGFLDPRGRHLHPFRAVALDAGNLRQVFTRCCFLYMHTRVTIRNCQKQPKTHKLEADFLHVRGVGRLRMLAVAPPRRAPVAALWVSMLRATNNKWQCVGRKGVGKVVVVGRESPPTQPGARGQTSASAARSENALSAFSRARLAVRSLGSWRRAAQLHQLGPLDPAAAAVGPMHPCMVSIRQSLLRLFHGWKPDHLALHGVAELAADHVFYLEGASRPVHKDRTE